MATTQTAVTPSELNSIRLYSTDGEISVCKDGVPSEELNVHVANGGAINCGCSITDLHDAEGYGAK